MYNKSTSLLRHPGNPNDAGEERSWQFFIVTQPHDYVTHVQINRPSKLNSFTTIMWHELEQIFDQISVDPNVRVVVLSGVGDRAFTTGIDVQAAAQNNILGKSSIPSFTVASLTTGVGLKSSSVEDGDQKNRDAARRAVKLRRHILEFQRCISSVERCEKPVICVMHGFTYGLGIDISACADIRICSADTQFAVKEVEIGLAADIGTLTRLPKIVGNFSWVKDVALSARTFDAHEAFRVGFVSDVRETKALGLEEAFRMSVRMAAKSPIAVQGTKELLNHSRDHSVSDSLRYTGIWNSAALQTDDVNKALLSGIKRTNPRFEKL
ncbi:Delta-dienoyl-CoA isomerase, mitochondrial [Golovinomyces cichoracearum]|uniref:Delta-dienoyl-CoA isomerase, mitochondrial n=1 Tax=Golovinomyces cichoracearum TaxID=62708 RepID=A0A420I1M1_9PEZI|nr:Delta-dienoyl-CoA isomerase, mitochondrial [Golovinomyces cichoracearum]